MTRPRTWTFLLLTGVLALVAPLTPAFSTDDAEHAAAEREYRGLEELPLTAGDEQELEQHAVELAYALNEVPVSAQSSESCPIDRLEVEWERPTGYEVGAYIEPVGPPPGPDTTHVSGVVVCEGSTYAFMGFEANRDDGGVWQLASVPDLPGEDGLELGGFPFEGQDAPPNLTDLSGLLSSELGPVDPYAPYEPQRICDPVEKPATAALARLLLERYPSTVSFGITRPCDVGGRSEHKEGRAFDWGADVTDAEERAAVADFIAKLMASDAQGNRHALARRLGVMYVIWNNSIWSSYRAQDGWRPYHGPSPHTDHLHLSLSWDGALGQTSLWETALPEGWWNALPTFEAAGESFHPAVLTSSLARWQQSWNGPRTASADGSQDEPSPQEQRSPNDRRSPDESPSEDSGQSDDPVQTAQEPPEDTVEDVAETVGDIGDDPTSAPSEVTGTLEDTVDDTTGTVEDTTDDLTGTVETPTPLPTLSESFGLD